PLPEQEFVMSAALSVEWGNTGAAGVGAEPFSTITPTIFFGKGFGTLPDSVGWLRPIGLTGQIGYAIPTRSSTVTLVDADTGEVDIENHPRFLTYAFSLQYSLPHLKSQVVDLCLPHFING